MDDTNVNSEMSSLVRNAEEWANEQQGASRGREVSESNLRLQRIHFKLVERAIIRLMEQEELKTEEDVRKYVEKLEKRHTDIEEARKEAVSPISPMDCEEFNKLMKNGWSAYSPSSSPPVGTERRRLSMFDGLVPMSPILSESGVVVEKPVKVFKTPSRRTIDQHSFHTSTPINRSCMNTLPSATKPTPKRMMTRTPAPLPDEGPLENKASRLRRMKIEEKRRMSTGTCKNYTDRSTNHSFY